MAISSDLDLSEGHPLVRRALTFVILLAVAGGAGYAAWWFYFRDSGTAAVTATQQTATVTLGNIVGTFTGTGSAVATQSSKLTFASSGQVKSVSVIVGDQVKSGQELARLDDKDAQRKLETAKSNLQIAQLKYQQLVAPPTADALASAQQSLINAQNQVVTAQANLDKAQQGPADTDVIAADTAILQAQNGVQSALNNVDSSWTSLVNAQRAYCGVGSGQANICTALDIPLTDAHIADLNAELRNPTGTSAQITAIVQAAQQMLSTNTAYNNAKAAVGVAQKNLDSANAKKVTLMTPPTASTIAQLQGALDSAKAGVVTAQAKLDTLKAGPTALDLAVQQQSVQQAQIAVQTAQDTLDGLTMRAPYDGTIGAISFVAGDTVGAAASVTLTNTSGVRVDLSVSESDLPNIKAGQFGAATFDSLPGQTFLVKVTGVSTAPTVTQGVVTYAVQTQILRGPDLQSNAAELQKLGSALGTLLGGGRAGFAGGAAGQRTPGPQGGGAGANASRSPQASRTPQPGQTPGAAGGPGGGGGGFAALAAPTVLPSAGMTASVTLVTNVLENTLLLPTNAIKRQGRTNYVLFLKPDGTTEQRTITVGGADAANTAILTGLAEGDKVVTGATGTAATRTTGAGQNNAFGGGPVTIGGPGGGAAPGGVR